MSVTVNCVRDLEGTTLVDCERCGPLGLLPDPDVATYVYNHLEGVHGCNMDHVDIRNHDDKP